MATYRSIIRCVAIQLSLTIAAGAGEPMFTYYDLGSLGLPVHTHAYDINDLGMVAGMSDRSHEDFASAYTWHNGSMTDHTDSIPGGWLEAILGISEKGPMAGVAPGYGAVIWRDGVGYYPDVPDGCQANAGLESINTAGTLAVGNCQEEDGYDDMPALYFADSGSGLAIGFLPDTAENVVGYAFDVNDSGIVVGWFTDSRAYYWKDGEFTEISVGGYAINNAGLIVGSGISGAMSYDVNTGLADYLGPGVAFDVNERRSAVGRDIIDFIAAHAMLYENTEVVDLHELILGNFLQNSRAKGINNHGWIIGYGDDFDGNSRGWLLVRIHSKGDFDGDGDVDLQDSGHFQRCFAAEAYIDGTLHVGCSVFDFDDDIDLDLDDYAAFQSAFTGPTARNNNPNGPG